MPSVLLTGANRGLGFGLVELYAADGWRVYACCRDPDANPALKKIADESDGRVTLHALDVEDHAAIDAFADQLKGQPIDLLLNIAGFFGWKIMTEGGLQEFGTSDFAEWDKVFRVNVYGPMKMSEAFVDHVAMSDRKQIVTFTSQLGSVAQNSIGKMYPYRASKAAVNMMMKSMAVDLKPRGITALPLHPGWVRTDMGGPSADIGVDESVNGIKKVLDGLTPDHAGRFMAFDGSELPW